jgi:hypothetical protein
MRRDEQYQVLQQRCIECEEMALAAKDISIRRKFAELAIEYRAMAEQMRRLDQLESSLV